LFNRSIIFVVLNPNHSSVGNLEKLRAGSRDLSKQAIAEISSVSHRLLNLANLSRVFFTEGAKKIDFNSEAIWPFSFFGTLANTLRVTVQRWTPAFRDSF
jgi:hypothetical protein